jgi:hypothetical protein
MSRQRKIDLETIKEKKIPKKIKLCDKRRSNY